MKYRRLIHLLREKQIADAKKRKKLLGTDYGCEKIYDLNYNGDTDENHLCDLYYPRGALKEKLPVIMEVHGGGFLSGTKLINEGHGLYYASRGYKVVNINWTCLPEADFVGAIRELFQALHWIEDNAERYAFDPEKLFISGDSAGGFLVLLTAAVQNSAELQSYFNVAPVKKGIRGVAASCPCADVRRMLASGEPVWKLICRLAFQDPVYRSEDYLHHVSAPDTFLLSDYPKVFLSTTPTDGLLYNDTLAIHQMLYRLGIDHVYKEYRSRGNKLDHVFNVLFPQYEESIEANEDFLAYFREMVK